MIQSTDIEGRLRLFRYGLIVIVVVTFLVSLLVPYVIASPWAAEFNTLLSPADQVNVSLGSFLGPALLATLVVAVLMVVAYFLYRSYLHRSGPSTRA